MAKKRSPVISQYFLDDPGNFENFTNSWTYYWSFLGPWTPYLWLFLYQNTSKNIRKFMGTSWENIILTFWNFKKISNLDPRNTYFFVFCPPPPKKISFSERVQRIFRWWNLGILGQSFF